VDTEARNMNSRTPLHIAAEIGRVEIVRLLIEKEGANVNVIDAKKKTPLYLAARRLHTGVVGLLLADERTDVNVL
ncbi:ankyrin, partial [Tuber magnatum]